ncbi:MAG: peroxiredoxin [Sporichthyaceae bacterium]
MPVGQKLVEVGDQAPEFELKNQHGQPVRLSSFRGRKAVLLVFYPFAFTGVCGGELHALEAASAELAANGVALLAISVDSMYAQRVFAEREGFSFPMLADFWPHGGVASAYGVLHEDAGVARRGSFLVDVEGTVRWMVLNEIPDARDIDEVTKAMTAL